MKRPKLTMTTWRGELPMPGQYCMTEKGRTAYLILELIIAKPGQKHAFKVFVERTPRERLHPDDVVHWFRWNKRT